MPAPPGTFPSILGFSHCFSDQEYQQMKQKTRACCPPPHEVFLHKRPAVFLWLIECHFEFCLSPLQWPKPFGGVWASVSGLEVLERLFCRGHAIASCLFSAGVRSDSLECLLFKRGARGKDGGAVFFLFRSAPQGLPFGQRQRTVFPVRQRNKKSKEKQFFLHNCNKRSQIVS